MLLRRFRWEPTIDDMCDEYDLDNRVCEFDSGSKERERAAFTFNLICKADQGNLYRDENDDGEVMVSELGCLVRRLLISGLKLAGQTGLGISSHAMFY